MTANLASRLEAATEGSRELSNEVLLACGWQSDERGWWYPQGDDPYWWLHHGCQPSPTESVDEAGKLVEAKGWWWTCGNCRREGHATIGPEIGSAGPSDGIEGLAATPALALSAALVHALENP